MGNILMVCRKNVIRSPMAELLTKISLDWLGYDLKSCEISSAGIDVTGEQVRMSRSAVTALYDLGYVTKGYDPNPHVPEPITPSLLSEIDLVLTAEDHHRNTVLGTAPELKGRVYTMTSYVGLQGQVSDPVGDIVGYYNYRKFRPLWWKDLTLYRGHGGKVHAEDKRAMRRLYKRKAEEIEKIVAMIIPKLAEDGLVKKLAA